jgi:LacI family transcriptional regulator
MAFGCLDALADEGLCVPNDVRVAGFDDIPAASLRSVQLTTVRGVPTAVGQHAVDLLLDRTIGDYRGAPRTITIPAEIVIRSPCGCNEPA